MPAKQRQPLQRQRSTQAGLARGATRAVVATPETKSTSPPIAPPSLRAGNGTSQASTPPPVNLSQQSSHLLHTRTGETEPSPPPATVPNRAATQPETISIARRLLLTRRAWCWVAFFFGNVVRASRVVYYVRGQDRNRFRLLGRRCCASREATRSNLLHLHCSALKAKITAFQIGALISGISWLVCAKICARSKSLRPANRNE